jgi:hypothetical protein
MRWSTRALGFAAVFLATAIAPFADRDAAARTAYESPYTFEQTFGTATRLLRVDLGCKITEKDLESGYLLFDYTSPESGQKVHHGSLEAARAPRGTHVSVQLPTLPGYHEQMIVDALRKKLLDEYGEPPPRDKPPPPPAPVEDGGTDGSP